MSKILAITGATGKKSGGSFINHIIKNIDSINYIFNDGIRIISRYESDTSDLEKANISFEIRKGNFNDLNYLNEAFKDVDTIVHIAGIRQSKKIVDAAIKNNVRRLILVHTTGVYSKYKVASEDYKEIDKYVKEKCNENKILLTICRPTMIYGNIYDKNVIKFIKLVDKFKLTPIVNGARYELQPVHYEDLGKAYYDILINEETTKNKDFNLSGANPIYLRTMLEVIGTNLGKKVHFISCPFIIAYIGSWLIYICTFTKVDYREKVQRLCEPRVFSHEDASLAFGYNPRTFEEGVKAEVNEYLNSKK